MTEPIESYLKFHYGLRPKKQVERRMIIDALHIMSRAGFQIGDYQYTGFGSIYFVDFILFHKLLGINRMLSVEHSEHIKKRVKFNCPYSNINIEMGPISDYIPSLGNDIMHLLWLDYDCVLNNEIINDITLSAAKLTAGSILLITTDNEPPKLKLESPKYNEGPKEWMDYFKEQAGDYFDLGWNEGDFGRDNLWYINTKLLFNAISKGLSARSEIDFFPIFKFIYADGHEMTTLGGTIGSKVEKRRLKSCDFDEAFYIRQDIESEPYRIIIPPLTHKEKLYLDSAMPCDDKWTPRDFELDKKFVAAYREIYRFYPHYVEMLM